MPFQIAVLVKQVPDMNAVRIDRASGKPVMSGQMTISSFDEYALEEAFKLRARHGGEVVAVCAGPATVKDAITRALAKGADRGVILSIADPNGVEAHGLAAAIADFLKTTTFDIVLAGQYSDDVATGQVGPRVAAMLGMPWVGSIAAVESDGETLTIARDTEDGRQTLAVAPPVMLLAQAGLNEPQLPSLKGIMAAKKKPVETVAVAIAASANGLSWGEPYTSERQPTGVIVRDAAPGEAAKQLVGWLKEHRLV